MKSWRSRVATAVAVGVAAVAIPLSAGSASAAETGRQGYQASSGWVDQWGYEKISGWRDKLMCQEDGEYALAHGYVNYYCAWEDPYWTLWALPR